jgi:hypothetical protein
MALGSTLLDELAQARALDVAPGAVGQIGFAVRFVTRAGTEPDLVCLVRVFLRDLRRDSRQYPGALGKTTGFGHRVRISRSIRTEARASRSADPGCVFIELCVPSPHGDPAHGFGAAIQEDYQKWLDSSSVISGKRRGRW